MSRFGSVQNTMRWRFSSFFCGSVSDSVRFFEVGAEIFQTHRNSKNVILRSKDRGISLPSISEMRICRSVASPLPCWVAAWPGPFPICNGQFHPHRTNWSRAAYESSPPGLLQTQLLPGESKTRFSKTRTWNSKYHPYGSAGRWSLWWDLCLEFKFNVSNRIWNELESENFILVRFLSTKKNFNSKKYLRIFLL